MTDSPLSLSPFLYEKSNNQSIKIKFENMTTILNFDTLVLSLYYHQYKFNDLNPTQKQHICKYNAQAHCNNNNKRKEKWDLT